MVLIAILEITGINLASVGLLGVEVRVLLGNAEAGGVRLLSLADGEEVGFRVEALVRHRLAVFPQLQLR
jgi:hypothetical protein